MKSIKITSIALCCAIAILSFASCGKKTLPGSTSQSGSSSQSQVGSQSQSEPQAPAREAGFYPDGTKKDISVVGKVADTDVSFETFRLYFLSAIKNMQASGSVDDAQAREQTITTIKESAAIKALAKELNLTFTAEDEDKFKAYMDYQKSNFASEDEFKAALTQSFLSEELLMEQVKENELFTKVFGSYFLEDVKKNVADNFVHVKHILVQFPEGATEEQKTETKAKADDIAKKLADGAVFEDMVKEYDEDPGQTEAGYYFTYNQMVKPFEEKAFEMKIGDISEPVLTDYGYHIIKKYEFETEEVDKNFPNYASEELVKKFYDIIAEKAKEIEFTPCEDWDLFTSETVS